MMKRLHFFSGILFLFGLTLSHDSSAQMSCNTVLSDLAESSNASEQGEHGNEATSAPKTKEDRIEEAKAELARINLTLQESTARIKQKLVGMDTTIEEIARRIYSIWDAKAHMRPLSATSMMSLFGFSGVGKTAVIEEFSKMLGMTVTTITITKDSYYIPIEKILANGRPISPPVEGDPGPISLNLDFIILIDEIQNLKSHSERQAYLSNPPSDDKQKAEWKETTEKMKESEDVLWSILGSGFGEDNTADPTRSLARLSDNIANFKANRSNIATYERQNDKKREALSNPETTDIQKTRYEQEILENERYKEELNKADDEFKNEIAEALESLKDEYGSSLGTFANMPTERLVEYVIDFEKPFRRKVLKNFKELRKVTPKKSFSEGLFFVAGNPEEIIADLSAQAMDRRGRVDPTILRRLTEELNPEAMRRFFFKLFGSDRAGWQTRWGLSRWKMLKPFSEDVWKQLVLSKIRDRIESLQVTIRTNQYRSVEFVIDNSLIQSLYDTEIDPAGGGRQSGQNLENVLAALPRSIPGFIDRHIRDGNWREKNRLYKLKLSSVPGSTDVQVTEEDSSGPSLRATFPLVRSLNPDVQSRNEIAVAPLQQAVYQAARVVVGTVLMGAFPRTGVRMTPGAGELIENSWARPDSVDLRYLRNKMAIAVSGAVAERLLIEDSGVILTTNAELDKVFISEVISEIRRALLSRAEIERTRHPNDQVITLDLLYPNSSIRFDEIIRSIYARQARARSQITAAATQPAEGNAQRSEPTEDDSLDYLAIRALDKIAADVITSQPDLIRAIAAELTRKPFLSQEELQQIFRTYANQRPEPSVPRFQAVFDRARKWLRLNPRPVQQVTNIQISNLLSAQAGSIQNPLAQVSQAPAVRPGPRTLTQRLGDRMRRFLRETRSNLY